MTQQFVVRPYHNDDFDQIRLTYRTVHDEAMRDLPADRLAEARIAIAGEMGTRLVTPRESYDTPPNHLFIVSPEHEPRRVSGYCALVRIDDRQCELKNVVVHPDYQGYGVARVMMQAYEDQARRDGYATSVLWTYAYLTTAAHMYIRRGYRIVPLEIHPDMFLTLGPIQMELDLSG